MKTKTIVVDSYPCTFEFKTRTELPVFDNDEHLKVDWDNITDEEYRSRPQYEAEKIRRRVLRRHMKKMNVYSPCHAYEDYVVEIVIKTENGEIWRLGS